jgi:hypothetical protein
MSTSVVWRYRTFTSNEHRSRLIHVLSHPVSLIDHAAVSSHLRHHRSLLLLALVIHLCCRSHGLLLLPSLSLIVILSHDLIACHLQSPRLQVLVMLWRYLSLSVRGHVLLNKTLVNLARSVSNRSRDARISLLRKLLLLLQHCKLLWIGSQMRRLLLQLRRIWPLSHRMLHSLHLILHACLQLLSILHSLSLKVCLLASLCCRKLLQVLRRHLTILRRTLRTGHGLLPHVKCLLLLTEHLLLLWSQV